MNIDGTEADLWVAVLTQALYDATLGVSPTRKPVKPSNNTFSPEDIRMARRFIKGQTRALRDICEAMGMEYETTREQLLQKYRSLQQYLPSQWRDPDYEVQA